MKPLERIAGELAGMPGDAVLRARLLQTLRDGEWPSARDERWRYANLASLNVIEHFAPRDAASAVPLPPLPDALPGYRRLLLCDGRPAGEHQSLWHPAAAGPGGTGFGLLAALFAPQVLELELRDGDSVELLHAGSAGASSYARLRLHVAPGARARLLERHVGGGEPAALRAPELELAVGRAAELDHYRLQDCDGAVRWFDTVSARLEAGSQWRLRQLSLGAHTARSTLAVSLAGERAGFALHALALGAGAQTHDLALSVEHQAGSCRSEQTYRGIAAARARAAISADVLVAAEAPGSDVVQSLKGLLAGPGAEIDLRPRLTIHTDAVQARHGATTGQLDQQLLFYLLSRGLEPEAASALLKWAFVSEVLRAVDVAALRAPLARSLASRLGADWLAEAAL